MGSYERVLDALDEHDLKWTDVDRVLLNEDTHMEFYERSNGDLPSSNYSTRETPAVRVTTGEEKIIYVNKNGYEVDIKL